MSLSSVYKNMKKIKYILAVLILTSSSVYAGSVKDMSKDELLDRLYLTHSAADYSTSYNTDGGHNRLE